LPRSKAWADKRTSHSATPLQADHQRARELVSQANSGLRAGDALHLATALRLGANQLATLDRVLAGNAATQGLTLAIKLPA
jgi:predicted nucleic acid-binding protein